MTQQATESASSKARLQGLVNFCNPRAEDASRFVGTLIAVAFSAILLMQVLPQPVHASSQADQAAGAEVFHAKGCVHCHGVEAMGTDKGPDLSTVGKRLKKPAIEHQIVSGGAQMPPFGSALNPDEVKLLVDFLSAKRKATHKTP